MMKRSLVSLALALGILAATRSAFAQEEPESRDPISLDDLVVTVHRVPVSLKSTSATVTVLDGHRLEAAGFASVADALRTVPGLAVVQSGSFGSFTSVFMRGGESDYVGVLIDGVQVNEPGGRFDFANLPVDQIERIEIVRGPASAMYGSDAVTGVIQIITRTGAGALTGDVRLLGGTYDSWRGSARVEGGSESATYGFSVSELRSGGMLPVNNDYDTFNFSGRIDITPDEDTDLRLSAHYSDHTFHFPTDGAGAVVDENAFSFGDDLTLGLDLRRRLSPAVEVAVLLSARDSEGGTEDLRDGPADSLGFFQFRSLDDVRRASADLRANVDAGDIGRFSAGLELEDQNLRSLNESDSEFGPSSGSSEESRSNRAYYGQWLGSWGALSGNGALRLEDNETFGSLVTYSLGSAYYVDGSDTKFRISLGRGIKDPTLFENFATGFAVGNPDLVPEESFSWEIGVDQLVGADLRFSATYFDQSFEDLIQFTSSPPQPGGPSFFNVGAADARGLETEIAARLGAFDLSASYTYLDTKVTDAGFEEGDDATFVVGEALLRRPTHQLGLSAIGRLAGRGTAGATLNVVGARVDRDFSSFPFPRVELAAYATVDVHGDFQVLRARGGVGLSVVGRVENLLDEEYVEVHGFPARGRTVWLGGRARFRPD